MAVMLGGVKNGIFGIFGLITRPGRLVGALALGCIWAVMAWVRLEGSALPAWLEDVFYSPGGLGRSGLGVLGGWMGQACVGAAWMSISGGGLGDALKGLGGILKKTSDKKSLLVFVLGMAASGLVYWFFTGTGTYTQGMASPAAASALLHLQALGRRRGFLYQWAGAVTSLRQKGGRFLRPGRALSWLSGGAVGSLLIALWAWIG